MGKYKGFSLAAGFFLIFLLIECQNQNQKSEIIYKDFINFGEKENKVIYVMGKRGQYSNQCSSCQENKKFDSWKGLYRLLHNCYENVECIVCLPSKLAGRQQVIPLDIIKYYEINEPENDVFIIAKRGQIIFVYKGLLDMETIRYIFDLMGDP